MGGRLAVSRGRSIPCGQSQMEKLWKCVELVPRLSHVRRRDPCEPRLFVTWKLLRSLKQKFQRKLHQPRVTQFLRLAKSCARVSGVAINAIELRVVERVIDFRPEFHTQLFANLGVLEDAQVPIVDGRIAADRARCIPKLAKSYCRGIRRRPGTRIINRIVELVRIESKTGNRLTGCTR